MSPKARTALLAIAVLGGVAVVAATPLAVVLYASRPRLVRANTLATEVTRGQLAASDAEMTSHVLIVHLPRTVHSLTQLQPGDYLIVGNGYLLGQTSLAADRTRRDGYTADYYVLEMPVTMYRRRPDGDFDRLRSDSPSIVRVASLTGMGP